MVRYIISSLFFLSFAAQSYANSPLKMAIVSKHDFIDSYINNAIEEQYFPGAQLVIGTKDEIIYSKNYGYHDYSKAKEVETEDVYDVASCTKIMSTTLAIMKLIDDGKITLTTKIKDILREYNQFGVGNVTVAELLKHTSGLLAAVPVVQALVEPANDLPMYTSKPDAHHSFKIATRLYANDELKYKEDYVSTTPKDGYYKVHDNIFLADSFKVKIDSMVVNAFNAGRRGRYRYSDLNFYFLSKIIEKTSGKNLSEVSEEMYSDIGVLNIGFSPLSWKSKKRIVPTEYDYMFRRDTVRGYVHDEFAAALGGVNGNAGLFSNAESMAVICQLFLNKGTINEHTIIKPETVTKFTSNQVNNGVYRGYGFDKQGPTSKEYSRESYGHTGFTGTYFWVDPKKEVFVVFLTNRVNPSRLNTKLGKEYRSKLWETITNYDLVSER
ncbi:MAG: serine hydrolase [Rikenellaceae bacterium]